MVTLLEVVHVLVWLLRSMDVLLLLPANRKLSLFFSGNEVEDLVNNWIFQILRVLEEGHEHGEKLGSVCRD